MIRMTTSPIRARARRGCRPIQQSYELSTKEGFSRPSRAKEPSYTNELKLVSRCTQKRHASYIRFYGEPGLKTPVWVWCDCDYFKYYLEVSLARRGSSSLRASNGKAPTIRNPHMNAYLCKHLMLAAEIALTKKDLIRPFLEQEMSDIPETEELPKHAETELEVEPEEEAVAEEEEASVEGEEEAEV